MEGLTQQEYGTFYICLGPVFPKTGQKFVVSETGQQHKKIIDYVYMSTGTGLLIIRFMHE